IREGYAHEYTFRTSYKYQAQFKAAEQEAREHERGLWSAATCGGNTEQPAVTPAPTAAVAPTTALPPTATALPVPTLGASPTSTPAPVPTAISTRIPASAVATSSSSPVGPRTVFETVQGAGPNRQAHVAVRIEPPRAGIQCSIRYFT